jgi:hypothetical protein
MVGANFSELEHGFCMISIQLYLNFIMSLLIAETRAIRKESQGQEGKFNTTLSKINWQAK